MQSTHRFEDAAQLFRELSVTEDKPVKKKEQPNVEVLKTKETRTLQNYDFDKYEPQLAWTRGFQDRGAIAITGHGHICALYAVSQSFTTNSYKGRIEMRGRDRYDHYGSKMPILPKMTVEELMMMDMDYLMSCINEPSVRPVCIELFTNDTEDVRWLKFIERCPYAYKVYSVQSKMDKYKVHCWIISKEDPRP